MPTSGLSPIRPLGRAKYGWRLEAMLKGDCPVPAQHRQPVAIGRLPGLRSRTPSRGAGHERRTSWSPRAPGTDPAPERRRVPGTRVGLRRSRPSTTPASLSSRCGTPPACTRQFPPACEENPDNYAACGSTTAENYQATSPDTAVAGQLPAIKFLDFSKYFCQGQICPAVIGNVLVYKDDNHVTRTYMEPASPRTSRRSFWQPPAGTPSRGRFPAVHRRWRSAGR